MDSAESESNEAYISGKVGEEEAAVRKLMTGLEELGYVVKADWTEMEVKKPYLEHREHNLPAALAMVEGVRRAKLFVLLDHERLLGGRYETGMAFIAILDDPSKQVFIVGEDIRPSLFHVLPRVTVVDNEETVLEILRGESQQ